MHTNQYSYCRAPCYSPCASSLPRCRAFCSPSCSPQRYPTCPTVPNFQSYCKHRRYECIPLKCPPKLKCCADFYRDRNLYTREHRESAICSSELSCAPTHKAGHFSKQLAQRMAAKSRGEKPHSVRHKSQERYVRPDSEEELGCVTPLLDLVERSEYSQTCVDNENIVEFEPEMRIGETVLAEQTVKPIKKVLPVPIVVEEDKSTTNWRKELLKKDVASKSRVWNDSKKAACKNKTQGGGSSGFRGTGTSHPVLSNKYVGNGFAEGPRAKCSKKFLGDGKIRPGSIECLLLSRPSLRNPQLCSRTNLRESISDFRCNPPFYKERSCSIPNQSRFGTWCCRPVFVVPKNSFQPFKQHIQPTISAKCYLAA